MTFEERNKANTIIDGLVGTWEEHRKSVSGLAVEERIKRTNNFRKIRDSILKIAEKEGIDSLYCATVMRGGVAHGVTKSGKKYAWVQNKGFTESSRYCGTLYIEGIGTVFTRGKIDKIISYIINN